MIPKDALVLRGGAEFVFVMKDASVSQVPVVAVNHLNNEVEINGQLEPGMVVSMEPMLWIPEGQPGAGGYREHDILVVNENGAENITGFPYGPDANIVPA